MARQLTMANVLLAAGVLALGGSLAHAQDKSGGTASSGQTKSALSAADKKFAMDAAHGGVAEVRMGELAAKQGSSQAVKDFGQKMVDDHSKANEELMSVASNKGITLPTEPNAEQKATMARLSKLHGAAFDAAYIKAMKADHQKDIAEFKKEATKGKDADIKGFASKTLPVVQGHYQMLTSMHGSGGKMSSMKKM
jgi:putative membrane protein